jgi:lipoprotein signal peptidase
VRKILKRVLVFSFILILFDQILRFYAQYNLVGKIIGNNTFGLTYKVNYGLWVYPEAPGYFLLILQIIFIFILLLVYFGYQYFCKFIRKSLLIDLAYSFFIAAAMGNVYIDPILLGYVRDYFINPIAISNLADLLYLSAIILLILEILLFKESRILLKFTDKEDIKKFMDFIKCKIYNRKS